MSLKALTITDKYVVIKVPYALENVSKLCLVYNHVQIVGYICTVSNCITLIFRLWYCLTWSQFKRETEWILRTVTRIQDTVRYRITQSHDTFQTVVLFDVVAV
ncbi:hypothetical protein DPMN_132575 [Dreissena polymorpha]|uniref:Uncharacterized protein n=1 Tax=Dreissena polymorpha TaxID=45954 RepID=A0A9D4J909_DREPO|nr:hypothetical protein DPMN_132575 [Dreissena polymorpha]